MGFWSGWGAGQLDLLLDTSAEIPFHLRRMQVVLLGDGFDTRAFRLPWPEGTVIFLAAPGEVR